MVIKISAIELVFKVMKIFSEDTRSSRMVSLFIEFTTSANEEIKKKISFLFGKIFYDVNK